LSVGDLPVGWQLVLLNQGDRMQKAGKERMTISGTLTRAGSAKSQFQVIHELPNSIRFQEDNGSGGSTAIVFDGTQYGKSNGSLQKADDDLVETLAYDSPTAFLYAPASGLAIRKLGSRFRSVGSDDKVFAGSAYDVYAIMAPVQQSKKIKQQPKFYHINSDTYLLERIGYQDADNPATKIEIVLSDWTTVSGNKIPRQLRRLENGIEVLRLDIATAAFGPAVADGSFKKP
jgi:hypothetical protein